jgi:CubicO group peptidase (beta-lactamase class C family)
MDKDAEFKEDPAFNGFDQYVENILQDWKIPGMGIAVIREDQVIFAKGFGYRDLENKLPVDPDTLFAIGSATKAFTSMGVALLVEQGKLEWDKPVREYMPDFTLYDSFATERMTPRDLLCHRSGLPRHDLMWWGSKFTRKQIYERLRYLEPNYDFRTQFQYQNTMIMTAGYMVECLTGMTWEEFTRKEIFEKLGMNHSNFSVEESKKNENAALPYTKLKDTVKQIPFLNIDALGPTGSINSNVVDMAKWVITQLNMGRYQDKQILSPAIAEQMHTPTMLIQGSILPGTEDVEELGDATYGLAWFLQRYRGRRLVYHTGNNAGFSALVSFMPDEKVGIVILSNLNLTFGTAPVMFNIYDRLLGLEPLELNKKMVAVVRQMEESGEDLQAQSAERRKPDTKPSHDLEAYSGAYAHPGYGTLKVELTDEKLKLILNTFTFNLVHYHYDVFEAINAEDESMHLMTSFQADLQGNIANLTVPLEPMVKDIFFTRVASEEMRQKDFLEKFVGKYRFMETQIIDIVLKGNRLAAMMTGAPEMEVEPYQGMQFKLKGVPLSIEFKMQGGKTTGADLLQGGAIIPAEKVE